MVTALLVGVALALRYVKEQTMEMGLRTAMDSMIAMGLVMATEVSHRFHRGLKNYHRGLNAEVGKGKIDSITKS
jgi:hypothetical protein